MNVEYVDWGIGNNYGDTIELNKNLLKYPKLHRKILDHEFGHTKDNFNIKDINHDLTERKVGTFELMRFMIKNPKSLTQFLPFYFHKKYGFVYDFSLIFIYLVIILVVFIGIYLGIKI